MFKPLLLAGLAAAALFPSLAAAQYAPSQPQCHSQGGGGGQAVGTILGVIGGALLGNAIGEHGGKPGGTIIGGIGGGVLGNRIGDSADKSNCQSNRYGYYDGNGQWVPNTSTTYGYYDANGQWVEGAAGNVRQAAPQRQAYAPPPTYAPPQSTYAPAQRTWAPAPASLRRGEDLAAREAWIDQDIRGRMENGTLNEEDGRRALHDLREIRREEANARDDDDRINPDQRADLERRLDDLANRLGENRSAQLDRPPAY